MYNKTKYIHVGLDLHKEQHSAVIMDCFNEKFGENTFQNKPSEFEKIITKYRKYCADGKGSVFALENSYAYRKSVPQYKKNDAMPEDIYWTLSQLVNRGANLKTHHIRLKNQLHEQVCERTQSAVYLRGRWQDRAGNQRQGNHGDKKQLCLQPHGRENRQSMGKCRGRGGLPGEHKAV